MPAENVIVEAGESLRRAGLSGSRGSSKHPVRHDLALSFSADTAGMFRSEAEASREEKMRKDGPNEPVVEKTGQPLPVERTFVKWPWGVIALGVLALAWVGAYLVWNGVVFLFQI